MAETGSGRPEVMLGGGQVLGAFGYTSMGADGWRVAQRNSFGGLTEDAVAEGARLIDRLTWWPDEALAVLARGDVRAGVHAPRLRRGGRRLGLDGAVGGLLVRERAEQGRVAGRALDDVADLLDPVADLV